MCLYVRFRNVLIRWTQKIYRIIKKDYVADVFSMTVQLLKWTLPKNQATMTTDKLYRKTVYVNSLFIKVSDAWMGEEDKEKHQTLGETKYQ